MKQLWTDFLQRPLWRKVCDILMVLFALAGAAIIGAWGLYQLGVTNNRGAVDKNYRYLMSVSEMERAKEMTPEELDATWAAQLDRLAALAHRYPVNARLILQGAAVSDDPLLIDRMVAALSIYTDTASLSTPHAPLSSQNAIPWMATPEWEALKEAIARDSALIREAGRLTGVEPRLIVGCLIGEQIRLFNSKREMYKKYLGPVKVLSVQSQFSYGVNGIKDFTAEAVEEHLKDPSSEYYMGPAYEHLLDYPEGVDTAEERYRRLVDYGSHLYSYIYTGCILHQTMLQWRRAGYDISDRPDLLFTLFNVGFSQSEPKPDPVPGGSHITVGDREYTFGAIGFDFYYSGELARVFPYQRDRFAERGNGADVEAIQASMTDCNRPERGSEYRQADSTALPATPDDDDDDEPDPFGIDHSTVRPMNHIAQ
ncbi:MAG: hypothetical protein IJ524_08930 [Bacteroidales bacterium]|nr:hypothetical protein [Bacteroidales bacterium]